MSKFKTMALKIVDLVENDDEINAYIEQETRLLSGLKFNDEIDRSDEENRLYWSNKTNVLMKLFAEAASSQIKLR